MLELKKLSYGVSRREIIRNLSLNVSNGELVVITGPNGSGKSTLAEIIMGIRKPSSGEIVFDGQNVTEKNITERSKLGIAFSFQKPVEFKGVLVKDLLKVALFGNNEANYDDVDAECKKLLLNVGLNPDEYLTREVNSSLSGGELKRIEIASVLAKRARLTIFDEPEAGIDIWSFDNLIKVFKSMQKNIEDGAIMIISHQEQLLRIADRIIILEDGKIARQGAASEIMSYIRSGK